DLTLNCSICGVCRSTTHRFDPTIAAMILLCEHPVRKLDARASNQSFGLASADQGHPRAALDTNDFWIRSVGVQHPVQSYGQLARRCHLGYSLRLLVTAMQI